MINYNFLEYYFCIIKTQKKQQTKQYMHAIRYFQKTQKCKTKIDILYNIKIIFSPF